MNSKKKHNLKKNNENNIVVFILDLNRSYETIRTVKSVIDNNRRNVDILVLINGSDSEHANRLIDSLSDESSINLYRSTLNLGFSGGNNFLINKLKETGKRYDYVLFLNNDAILGIDTLDILEKYLTRHKDVGIAGPRILKDTSDEIIENDGALVRPWLMQQSFMHAGRKSDESPCLRSHEVPFVTGTCMVIRYHLLCELGGFDNQFFAYFEDWDLCLRARKLGYKCFHVAKATVWHIGSLTAGKDSFLYHYLMTRNRYLMACKHLSRIILISIFIPYFIFSRVLYKTIALFFNGSYGGICGIYLALVWIIVPKKFKSRFWPVKNSG